MLGITDKNVGGNSNYTKKMYSHGIFDEVETEYFDGIEEVIK